MAWNDNNYIVIFILDYFEMIRNDEIRRNDSILRKDKKSDYDSLIPTSFHLHSDLNLLHHLNKQTIKMKSE